MPGRREGSDLGPQGLCKRTGLTSLMSTASILFSSTKVLCLAPRQLAVSNWAAEGGLRVRMRGNAKGHLPHKHSLNAIPHLNSEPPEQHQPLANRGGIEEGKECSERRWNLEEEEDRVSADESPAAPVWREEGRGEGKRNRPPQAFPTHPNFPVPEGFRRRKQRRGGGEDQEEAPCILPRDVSGSLAGLVGNDALPYLPPFLLRHASSSTTNPESQGRAMCSA